MSEVNKWRSMESAPKTGETIEVTYGDGSDPSDNCIAFWSDRPVCMLGWQNGGYPAGWATAGPNVDSNLPLDPPNMWRYEE